MEEASNVTMINMAKPDYESEDAKKSKNKPEQATVRYLLETLESLQEEIEVLKRRQVVESRQTPSGKIGFVLLAFGASALALSILNASTTLSFIGLGLTFWGALFLFARPLKFVRGTLLDSTAISSYATVDRIVQDLNYKGKPIYVPPYPKKAYLPEYLSGLKKMIVFIPAKNIITIPTIEEMAKEQFLLRNPEGICIAPPGYGLINLLEEELKTGFSQMDLEKLCDSLPNTIVRNLELAKELEMNQENDFIHITIVDSTYKDLYSEEQGFTSIHSIGCPLASAIACALAETTGKPVTLAKDEVSPDLKTIDVWYKTHEV